MQGSHFYQPCLFSYISPESLIPSSHILKRIDSLIELSFVKGLTSATYFLNNGRPSIDPELYFRMLLIGYLYGISSDRKLCEEIHYNLAYRWFCRLNWDDRVPHHSSLSRIRDRYGQSVFERFFQYVIALCQKMGLVKGECLMTDSTLIKANASLASLVALAPQDEPKKHYETGLHPPVGRKINNATHISRTDPDASLAHKKGTSQTLKYKVHHSIDSYKRIILDCYVTSGSMHESQVYMERLNHILKTYNIPFKKVVADRAYGSADILNQLIKQQIKSYIPLFSSRSGSACPTLEAGFIYDAGRDVFECVNKITLFPSSHIDKGIKTYRAPTKECRSCVKKGNCQAKIIKKSGRRYVLRSVFQDLYSQVIEDMKSPQFLKKLKERMWKMEGIIAEAKNLHTLNQAKYRRLEKVQIQAFMTASILNLKRLQSVN